MYFTIMDDDRAFGETLKNKLESEYHAVVDVYHGMIDLDQIKHVPDILFLDVIFENGTGVDYAKKYKEKFDSQIVFVSSKSSLIFKTQGLKALCFIRKSHLDNDFKVFKQLYDEESKNELEIGRKYKKEVNEAFRNYLMDKF